MRVVSPYVAMHVEFQPVQLSFLSKFFDHHISDQTATGKRTEHLFFYSGIAGKFSVQRSGKQIQHIWSEPKYRLLG